MSGRITGAAVVAGVVGWPVSQSLSPVLHNAWIEAAGLDAAYVPFAIRRDGFARWLEGLREGGVRGLNVTMPFKQEALALADRATDAARRAGGANTLVFEDDDTLSADSSDGRGILAALAEQAPAWRAQSGPVVVYGAGGTSGAAVDALLSAGAPQVRVVARDGEKAQALCAGFGAAARPFGWTGAATALADATALLNTTSLGFRGAEPLEIPWSAVRADAVVMDAVMTPLETPLLAAARARGHVVVDGLAMLIGQARPAFQAFFGVAPPVEADVRALALAAREREGVITLGLTGSIGMGKSTTAALFADAGVPVYDADAAVHALYAAGGGAVEAVRALFPGAVREGAVNRAALAAEVVGAPDRLQALEAVVHPLVAAHRAAFFAELGEADVVVLDIPLLFETGGDAQVDRVVVVSAPAAVQRERVLARPAMTPAKLDAILARQLPDAQKRARADWVIDTSHGIGDARRQVAAVLAELRGGR